MISPQRVPLLVWYYVYYIKNVVKIHVFYLLHNRNTLLQKQFCEITTYNQHDQNLVNYNKSYMGVKVTR